MAKARAIVKRRKAVENIRKITRTMELIATNRFRKALNRATEAEAYHSQDRRAGRRSRANSREVSHPLLTPHDPIKRALLAGDHEQSRDWPAATTATSCERPSSATRKTRPTEPRRSLEVAGKRGISFFRFRKMVPEATYTQFEDRPQFHEVEVLADRYIKLYVQGTIDRLDVAYTQFVSSSRQVATVQTLLPITTADIGRADPVGPAVESGREGSDRCRRRRASLSRTSSFPTPRASSKRSCRSRSRSGCSSASWMRRSASRSRAWSPWEAPPRTPTISSSRSRGNTTVPARTRSPASWPTSSARPVRSNKAGIGKDSAIIEVINQGFLHHGHRDHDRTNFPGDRLDI